MNVLIGVVLGGLVLAVLEARHQGISAQASVNVGRALAPPVPVDTYGMVAPISVGGSVVDQVDHAALSSVGAVSNSLKNVSSAIPIVGALIGAIAGTLLAAHTARLQAATSENQAVAKLMPSWQADMLDIAQKLNTRQITRAQAIAGVRKLDSQTKGYLQSHVGAAGTGWFGTPTGCPANDVGHSTCVDGGRDGSCSGPHNCGGSRSILASGSTARSCTVGCCIYYSYLEPAMDCFIKRIARGGSQGVNVPSIPGNKYGFPVYPAFSIQFSS